MQGQPNPAPVHGQRTASRRYARQLSLPGWGPETQSRLGRASVFLAGLGGLGSAAALYLAAAGVGRIVVCDGDSIEESNLNRQILYTTADIGRPKAEAARQRLHLLNPEIEVVCCSAFLTRDSMPALIGRPDVVLDCVDGFAAKLMLNEYCVASGIPLVHGAVEGLSGQAAFILPGETPCLRCFFRDGAPDREPPPVLGPVAGAIGSLMALAALRYLAGQNDPNRGKLLLFRGSDSSFRALAVGRVPGCPVCGEIGG